MNAGLFPVFSWGLRFSQHLEVDVSRVTPNVGADAPFLMGSPLNSPSAAFSLAEDIRSDARFFPERLFAVESPAAGSTLFWDYQDCQEQFWDPGLGGETDCALAATRASPGQSLVRHGGPHIPEEKSAASHVRELALVYAAQRGDDAWAPKEFFAYFQSVGFTEIRKHTVFATLNAMARNNQLEKTKHATYRKFSIAAAAAQMPRKARAAHGPAPMDESTSRILVFFQKPNVEKCIVQLSHIYEEFESQELSRQIIRSSVSKLVKCGELQGLGAGLYRMARASGSGEVQADEVQGRAKRQKTDRGDAEALQGVVQSAQAASAGIVCIDGPKE